MSYEGAMLGGYLLPEKEFITLMEELLDTKDKDIEMYLANTLNFINMGQIKNAYMEWNKFQTQLLLNPTTSLLAILNFYSSENQTWTFVDDEENAILNKSGALSIEKIEEGLKREYNSQILTKHLSNLFVEIGGKMEDDEIHYLYGLNKAEIYRQLNPIKYGDGVYTYKTAVYGNVFGKYLNGKVADAYLNHIGATHWEILNNFSQQGAILDGDHLLRMGVKQEERAVHNLNFIKLLMASTNRTAWYTGGDLIVTNGSGQVVANIQLKTSAGTGAWIGNIRTATLKQQIELIRSTLLLDHKTTAHNFYAMLKTSSVGESLGDAAIKEAYKMSKMALGLL